MSLSHTLAQRLPDLHRWVEARDLLLAGNCPISGLEEQPELALVMRDSESIFVIGRPDATAVQAAIQQGGLSGGLVAAPEQAAWLAEILPGWTYSRIIVHHLPNFDSLPLDSAGAVGWLDPATLPQLSIPADLLEELESGAEYSLIAATFVAGQPVAFCYAGAVTESLWDIAIDTLPDHRRQGYAGLCAAFMIRHMREQAKQPVWQSLADNPASWRLAAKLGFVPIDELAFFEIHEE